MSNDALETVHGAFMVLAHMTLTAGDAIGDEMSVVRESFLSLSVCMPKGSDLDAAEVLVREEREAGTTRGWKLTPGDDFIVDCGDDEARQHVLFTC